MEQTPLSLALMRGCSKIVERLVDYGANVNIQDIDGYASLHIILTRDTMEGPSTETPKLKKVSLFVCLLPRACDCSRVSSIDRYRQRCLCASVDMQVSKCDMLLEAN